MISCVIALPTIRRLFKKTDMICFSRNCVSRPRVLFSTSNNFLNPPAGFTTASSISSDDFLNSFIEKRSSIPTAANGCCNTFNVTWTLDHFNELSHSCLTDLVSRMKPTTSPIDLIPSRLLQEVFHVVCRSVLNIIYKSLISEAVLSFLNM